MKVNGYDWCASFVSWAAKAAGISSRVIVPGAGCGYWRSKSPNGGTFHKLWSNDFTTYQGYKPQVGDIALYTPTCKKSGKTKYYASYAKSSHAVIVCDVADKPNADGSWTFKTIERGNGNVVESKTLTTKTRRGSSLTCNCSTHKKLAMTNVPVVQGFCHPNWADGKSAPNHIVNSESKIEVTVSYPTDSTYLSKIEYTENNAVLVAHVTKPSGSKVNYVGLVMYDSNGNAVCDKTFSASNVSTSTTSFHVWFNVQEEMNVVLKPSSTYKYRIYTNIDGVKYVSPYWTFTTSK